MSISLEKTFLVLSEGVCFFFESEGARSLCTFGICVFLRVACSMATTQTKSERLAYLSLRSKR